jgi:hypothetical protein
VQCTLRAATARSGTGDDTFYVKQLGDRFAKCARDDTVQGSNAQQAVQNTLALTHNRSNYPAFSDPLSVTNLLNVFSFLQCFQCFTLQVQRTSHTATARSGTGDETFYVKQLGDRFAKCARDDTLSGRIDQFASQSVYAMTLPRVILPRFPQSPQRHQSSQCLQFFSVLSVVQCSLLTK